MGESPRGSLQQSTDPAAPHTWRAPERRWPDRDVQSIEIEVEGTKRTEKASDWRAARATAAHADGASGTVKIGTL